MSATDYVFRLAALRAAFAAHHLHLPELQDATDALWVQIEQAGLRNQVLAAMRES